MHKENLSYLVQLPEDFPLNDLRIIAQNLMAADVFLPIYLAPEIGLYEIEGFIYGADVERLNYQIFPDRNLASRIVSIARGTPTNQHSRLAANVMAFAQCLNIQFEPSISFHEFATSAGNESSLNELMYFRAADKAAPEIWVDLALGRKTKHLFNVDLALPPDVNLNLPLRRWTRNYIACLKIAELELSCDAPIRKMSKLLDWMFNEFILAGPAMCFAALYFSSKFPKKGMLKSLRSVDRHKAQLGIKNAAWDITYLSDCVRLANDPKNACNRFIFASNDAALKSVGQLIFTSSEEGVFEDQTISVLEKWWAFEDANFLVEKINSLYKNKSVTHRNINKTQNSNFIASMITRGEAVLNSYTI